jgi:hypothetical protein
MKIKAFTFVLAILVMILPSVNAAANFEVTAFSCSPDEVAVNSQFSCTATVENTGDDTGTLTTATLYPDGTSWLEDSSYAQTENAIITSGSSEEVVFSGLKGKKSGDNGFSKIMLDDVTDTYVEDNSVTVNAINVVVTTSDSASSVAPSSTFDATVQATAGGNVDMLLTFSVTSGGCSIGDQSSTSSTNSMTDAQTSSHTWTITMSTSDCVYLISAQATSNPDGTATKTDTTSSTIDCSGSSCSSDATDTSSSSSGSGGGGGGGGGSVSIVTDPVTPEEGKRKLIVQSGAKIGVNLTTGKQVVIVVDNILQDRLTVKVGGVILGILSISDRREFDLDKDGSPDLEFYVDSITLDGFTYQAVVEVRLLQGLASSADQDENEGSKVDAVQEISAEKDEVTEVKTESAKNPDYLKLLLLAAIALVAAFAVYEYFTLKGKKG